MNIPMPFIRWLTGKCGAKLIPVAIIGLLSGGCAQTLTTNPPRSATEQLLLSTATDRAIASISMSSFRGKRVYLDSTYFESYDSKYALGTIRDALSSAGAKLENDVTKSDVVVEVRSGALSIDANDTLIGIPKLGVPTPMTGALETPEMALYKSSRQYSIAKFALLAYETQSHEHMFSSGPSVGRAYNRYYKILGVIQWTGTDIPEKKKKRK